VGEWRFERLEHVRVRESFDCGKPSLNDFLHWLSIKAFTAKA
jgi:hypothetical protein